MTCIKVQDVLDILPDGVELTEQAIEMAIASAACMMPDVLVCNPGMTSTCQAQVQTYLAAHFAAVSDNTMTIKSEKDGCSDSSVTYGFQFGEGIKGTPFGQMANTLSRGCLAELDKTPANLFSIGTHGNDVCL